MCGGGKQQKSTQTSGYTSNAAPQLQDLIQRATGVSNTAYNPATQQQVAGFDPQQMQAFNATGAQQGAWQPFVNQAQQFAQQGASGITPGQIQGYQNPYENQVIANLKNDFNTQNQRELQNVTGNAAARGALGNSNVEVAKSLAMERARSGQDAQIANVRQQGFNTALGAAQGDRSAAQFGAGAMGALGNQAQQAGYTDIGALLASGGMQQGLQQRQFDTASGNAQAESAYPFQTTQWLASLLNPTASTMGGSTSGVSTTPGASPWNSILGGLSSAAGAWMLSDEDAKHDIKQVGQTNDGMPIYTFKYDGSDQTQMGLLAQDVEQRDPGAVAEFGGMKHVNYDRATENSMPEFAQGGEVDPDMRRLTSGLQHAVTGMMAARKAGGGEVGMVPYANAKSYVPVREVIGGKPDMPKMQAPQSQESGGGNLNSIGSALGKWMGRPSAPTTGWDATVTPEMASGGEVEAEWGSEVFKPFTSRLSDELQESEAGRLPMFATSAQPMMQAWRQGVDEDLDAKGLPANDPVMVAEAMPAFSPAPARSQEYAGEKKVINDGWTPVVTQEMPQTEAAKKAWYESGSNPALGRALMQAGFAMMASKSPHVGQAIGEGGLAGVGDYVAQQREGLEKRKAELQEQHRRDQVAQQQAQLAHQKDVLGETRRYHDNTAEMQQKQFDRQMEPEVIRKLEAAGYVRGTPEFQTALSKILTKDKTESAFDVNIAKASATDLEKRAEAIRDSQGKLQRIGQLEGIITNPAVYQGPGGEHVLQAKKVAQALGFNMEGIKDAETMRAISNQFALSLRSTAGGEGMPGALSDKDREFLLASVPSMTQTQPGNIALAKLMREAEQYKIKANAEAMRYIQHYKSNVGLGEYMTSWMASNPMISQETRQQATAAMQGAPQTMTQPQQQTPAQPPVQSEDQAKALLESKKVGESVVLPNGKQMIKTENGWEDYDLLDSRRLPSSVGQAWKRVFGGN